MSLILDGTNGLSDVDGSAATPALRGSDANTGIFFPAADTIAFAEGGAEVMRIDSSGNVGIGTSSPASKLDINTGASTGTTDMITLGGLDNASTKQTYGVIQMGIENNTASSEQGNILLQTVESGTVRTRININGSGYQAFSNGGTERARIDSSGNLLVTNAAGLGYGTGAGGTVTQATSKSTAVTLNKPTGQITTNNAALGSGSTVSFSVNNSIITATDVVVVVVSAGSSYTVQPAFVQAGVFNIRLTNTTGGSLSEAVAINFAVIKGATS